MNSNNFILFCLVSHLSFNKIIIKVDLRSNARIINTADKVFLFFTIEQQQKNEKRVKNSESKRQNAFGLLTRLELTTEFHYQFWLLCLHAV